MDFWGGTFCLALFATVETILFTWFFGMDKAWDEMHHGADLRIPRIYRFIMKYITPLFLIIILGWWSVKDGIPLLLMRGVRPEDKPYILGTSIFLVGLFVLLSVLVKIAWKKKVRNLSQSVECRIWRGFGLDS